MMFTIVIIITIGKFKTGTPNTYEEKMTFLGFMRWRVIVSANGPINQVYGTSPA